jgi:resuscitation-promoting factor RpfA
MRLVCPNCDAKYEVPEDAIPETGRDVQCANCGHAWFQMRRVAEVAPVAAPPVAPPAAPVAAPVAAPIAAPVPPAREPVVEAAAPVVVEPEPEPMGDGAPVIEAAGTDSVETGSDEIEAARIEDAETGSAGTVATVEDVAEDVAEEVAVVEMAAEAPPTIDAVEPVVEAALASVEEPTLGESVAADAATAEPLADDLAAAPEVVAEALTAPTADPVLTADLPGDADPVDLPASAGAIAAAGVAAYAVDESVLAILREEAEREAHARKGDAAKPLETQTDLGLDAAMSSTRKEAAVAADLVSGDETPEDRLTVRRTRLPDVEEINSTLRPSESGETEGDGANMAPVAEGRSGFRSGFLLVMTLAILASALYGSADAIASAVPALAGPLKGFVGIIDSLRLQLDGLMQSATVAIDSN